MGPAGRLLRPLRQQRQQQPVRQQPVRQQPVRQQQPKRRDAGHGAAHQRLRPIWPVAGPIRPVAGPIWPVAGPIRPVGPLVGRWSDGAGVRLLPPALPLRRLFLFARNETMLLVFVFFFSCLLSSSSFLLFFFFLLSSSPSSDWESDLWGPCVGRVIVP